MLKSQSSVFTIKGLMAALLICAATMTAKAEDVSEAVNINTADAEQLADQLVGIGPSLSQAIVEFREEEGDFVTVEHLEEVSGVGMATIENNRELLSVD